MSQVYLVDASIYIFRAWFAMPDSWVNHEGHPINALRGFFDFTTRFLDEVKPQYIAFVFDESLEHSYRNEIYPPYKENREPAPIELKRQIVQCRELIRALGILEIAHHHYEADDLIGTLAVYAKKRGLQVIIVSSDKDLAQLIQTDDIWWDYTKRRRFRSEDVKAHFGVLPEQIPDWLALAGDSVDNIPGIPGIGVVSAAKLLNYFGTIENLLNNLDSVEKVEGLRGASRISGLISEHAETLLLSRRLTRIVCDVPLSESVDMTIRQPDLSGFESLSVTASFREYYKRRFEKCIKNLRVAS